MGRIEEFASKVNGMPRQAFVEANNYSFLVLYRDEAEAKAEWSFKTATLSSKHIDINHMADVDGIALSKDAECYRVFGLIKSEGSPWMNRISVGRARNNDIVLPHNSVSKLHAHFTKGDTGGLTLSDAGSRNGTRINAQRILDTDPVPISPGDLITFGGISVTHIDSGGLYDLTKELIDGVA